MGGPGIRNPKIECPACGRALTSNLIRRHVDAHDPELREERRIDVVWLCLAHHMEAHGRVPKLL